MADNYKSMPDQGDDKNNQLQKNLKMSFFDKFKKQKSIIENCESMPQPYELQDLFNFHFNRQGYCFESPEIDEQEWGDATQSIYLFLKKFNGTEGLLEEL